MIELFSVEYRPSLRDAPIVLLCQSVDVNGEKLLWVDGINVEQPVMISISAVKQIEWMGSFAEFAKQRLALAGRVIQSSQGEHSPCILARAILYMSRDGSLSAEDALDMAMDQALDIIDADNISALTFSAEAEAAGA